MKLLIVNGSPRAPRSNSRRYAELFQARWKGEARYAALTAKNHAELAAAAAEGAPYDYVACCGPEPLMKIVAGMADAAGVFCEVSMERRMACGVGACLSCVVDTVDGKRRACVDGPVFPASEVVW